jgi:hypothetical protein
MADLNLATLATLVEPCREFVLDKRYEPPLRVAITVDVALRGLNRPVTREQLNVTKRAAGLVEHTGGAGNERPTTRMR